MRQALVCSVNEWIRGTYLPSSQRLSVDADGRATLYQGRLRKLVGASRLVYRSRPRFRRAAGVSRSREIDHAADEHQRSFMQGVPW